MTALDQDRGRQRERTEELEGTVLSSALDPAAWAARPPETVPSYGQYDAEAGDIEIDPAFLQKLQDMGYVGREGPEGTDERD